MANKTGIDVETAKILNVVDLFSGCGGLSLGFDLHKGRLKFRPVMCLDNWASAIKCLNENHLKPESAKFQIGRVCDLTWFEHESEVLLYYLTHYAFATPDLTLQNHLLKELEFEGFLSAVAACDQDFLQRFTKLSSEKGYRAAVGELDKKLNSQALFKSFLNKLGICSFQKASLDLKALPWTQEYEVLGSSVSHSEPFKLDSKIFDCMLNDAKQFFDDQCNRLLESSLKEGKGQHLVNAGRLQTFEGFYRSEASEEFKKIWARWNAQRNTIRAQYCLGKFSELTMLYQGNVRVNLVLGGPPCKGFSRIGRAVLDSLRNQGASAWSHHDFGDERNALMYKYVLFLRALMPEVFVFENVSNFQSELKTPNGILKADELLRTIIQDCSHGDLSYRVHADLYNSRRYSIPQDRIRYIMIGVSEKNLDDSFNWNILRPKQGSHEVNLEFALQGLGEPGRFALGDPSSCGLAYRAPAYSLATDSLPSQVSEYIDWIRQEDPYEYRTNKMVDGHIYRKGREDDIEFLKFVAPGIRWMDLKVRGSATLARLEKFVKENSKAKGAKDLLGLVNDSLLLRLMIENSDSRAGALEPNHLLADSYLKKGTGNNHGDWWERLAANKPCKTIVAHIGKDTYGYFHPYEKRAITIREAARVQSFPDFFKFSSIGVVDAYSVIGNAVSPLLANVLAANLEKADSAAKIFSRYQFNKAKPVRTQDKEIDLSF